ncbi:MAG: ABC transporter ATP-binding protein [Opitutae bacterium]|nr:ABC transporter ATP-binding protein [Opitutae bacterium]
MNVIETHRLTRRYWRTEAVHDLSLAVPAGSVFALLGPNGAGKTTLIKVLVDLLRPTAGEARIFGVDSRRLRPADRAKIGYVSENQQLPLWMTVRQFLDYCRPFYPTWDRALEAKLLAQFELPAERKLQNLSRGMLMKAALLSSLAYRPKLLLLDEPFSGLDPLVRDEFVRGILEISELGDWTVFVSSHDIEEVERLCDWIGVLDSGRLEFAQSTETLHGRFRRIEVALDGSEARLDAPPAAWLELAREGSRVRFIDSQYDRATTEQACRERFPEAAVTAHPMTLREIFIALARSARRAQKGAAA